MCAGRSDPSRPSNRCISASRRRRSFRRRCARTRVCSCLTSRVTDWIRRRRGRFLRASRRGLTAIRVRRLCACRTGPTRFPPVSTACSTFHHRRLLWEQLSRANREAIKPFCNSAVFSRQFIIFSVGSSPSVSASRKPVMSPSYSHSAAFAALALCNPYSEVPPLARTSGAEAPPHSSGPS